MHASIASLLLLLLLLLLHAASPPPQACPAVLSNGRLLKLHTYILPAAGLP
jgi:hypothetical protein